MVRDTFIKKKWDVNDSFFYVHFHNDTAVRQLERYPHRILKFSRKWNDRLFDQSLAEMELSPNDMISEEEFESVWNNIEIKPLSIGHRPTCYRCRTGRAEMGRCESDRQGSLKNPNLFTTSVIIHINCVLYK